MKIHYFLASIFICLAVLWRPTLTLAGCDPSSALKTFLASEAPKGSGSVMISVAGRGKIGSQLRTYQYTFQNNSDRTYSGTYGGFITLDSECKVVDSSLGRLEPLKP